MAAMLVGGALVTAPGNRPLPLPPPPRAGAPVAAAARAGGTHRVRLPLAADHADFRCVHHAPPHAAGVYTVQEFLLYWMQDMVRLAGVGAARAVGIAMLLLLAAARRRRGRRSRLRRDGRRRKAIVYGSRVHGGGEPRRAATAWPLAPASPSSSALATAPSSPSITRSSSMRCRAPPTRPRTSRWACVARPAAADGDADRRRPPRPLPARAPPRPPAARRPPGVPVVFWLATAYFVLGTVGAADQKGAVIGVRFGGQIVACRATFTRRGSVSSSVLFGGRVGGDDAIGEAPLFSAPALRDV